HAPWLPVGRGQGKESMKVAGGRGLALKVCARLEPGQQESPMSVDAATVKRIGRLARIRIEDGEVEKYAAELNTILGFVEQLGEVDVAGVEPMTSVTPMALRRRGCKVTDGGYSG